tara:strand:+ start:327 stop:578 length:252 start_codon:yes stop_codon:yes gene_type:complete
MIKANYWKVEECKYKLQLKTKIKQFMLEELLVGWDCVSYGYAPKTQEDIYIFEKQFKSVHAWESFINSNNIIELIEMKEVNNE